MIAIIKEICNKIIKEPLVLKIWVLTIFFIGLGSFLGILYGIIITFI